MSSVTMPGFHDENGGRLGEDTPTERFLSSHIAFTAVLVFWFFALWEATVGARIGMLLRQKKLFRLVPSEGQKHVAATLGMHLIFMPLSILGLVMVPFWAFEVGSSSVVARAVVWIDATILLLWEVRELFFLELFQNITLAAHHMCTCVVIIAILDFDLLVDVTWIQLLFLAANTAWWQRPVAILSKYVDHRPFLVAMHKLALAGVVLDVVQLACAIWFLVVCTVSGNSVAALVTLAVALPISYLRFKVDRWVFLFSPDYALKRQADKLAHFPTSPPSSRVAATTTTTEDSTREKQEELKDEDEGLVDISLPAADQARREWRRLEKQTQALSSTVHSDINP